MTQEAQRAASISRKTAETDVHVAIGLDGTGRADIATGVGFFDHMLELFARHGLFDLDVKVTGDLHVDHHHTVEDTGIALGQAFAQALADKRGIRRYADIHMPMDETLTRVAIDISGRPFLVFRTAFLTHEEVTLQFSRYLYNQRECEAAPADQSLCVQPPSAPSLPTGFGSGQPANPTDVRGAATTRPDLNVIKLQASMWW